MRIDIPTVEGHAADPQSEIGDDPAVVAAWRRTVEEVGYRRVLVDDHVLGAGTATRPPWHGAYTSDTPFHEVFVLLGHLAP